MLSFSENFRLSCKIKLEAHLSPYWSPVYSFIFIQVQIFRICFYSFHILSYVNLQSIKIGLLVLSHLCNSKSYNKYMAIPQTDIFFKGIQQKKTACKFDLKKLSCWVLVPFGSLQPPFISETTRARSYLVDKNAGRIFLKKRTEKKPNKIGLNFGCWSHFAFLMSWK